MKIKPRKGLSLNLGVGALTIGCVIILFFCFSPQGFNLTGFIKSSSGVFTNFADGNLQAEEILSSSEGVSYLSSREINKKARKTSSATIIEGGYLQAQGPPFLVSKEKSFAAIEGGEESSEFQRDQIIERSVKEGDTISSIAEEYGISVNTILWANDLSASSIINPGDKLLILPVSGVLHIVEEGDTISGLASIYDIEKEKIIDVNNLESQDDIFVGDMLILPGAEKQATPISPNNYTPIPESYFVTPVEGKITRGLHGVTGNAIDIANSCGSPVRAASGGVVQRAGPISVGGNRITIRHSNGVVSYYGHLSSVLVVPGQRVVSGEIIGRVGNTGYTLGPTGCHLHFALRGAKNFLSKYSVGSYISW